MKQYIATCDIREQDIQCVVKKQYVYCIIRHRKVILVPSDYGFAFGEYGFEGGTYGFYDEEIIR